MKELYKKNYQILLKVIKNTNKKTLRVLYSMVTIVKILYM